MRDGLRRWLIRLAWAGLIASGAMLAGLRIGRPLCYTDGAREHTARDLRAMGMYLWPTPEPQCELPGPVRGRVAALPDGRLLYGRALENGDTDLVLFDPALADVAPEPAFALDSEHHELSPAALADGTVFFASDRPGGAGGFDLYMARLSRGGFTKPEPVVACNTMRDETDPAPSPRGDLLVFARIDPELGGDRDGVLQVYRRGGDLDPEPLFGAPGRRHPVDRDPAFAPDGAALWFLRRTQGEPARIVRCSCLDQRFDEPVAADEGWGTGELRSPLPIERGRLMLLRPRNAAGDSDLWLASSGRELPPWWTGQRWLELLLLGFLLGSALLLLLLYLGRRWRSLDLVTSCLLLSLLVHLLLMLWLMGVEIAGSLQPGDDETGAVQVTLVGDLGGDGGQDGGQSEDLAATARFEPSPRPLDASAPDAALARAATELAAPEGTFASTAAASETSVAPVEVQDAAAPAALRDGEDRAQAIAAASLAAVAPAAKEADALRSAADAAQFRVEVPRSALGTATGARAALAAPAPASLPSPEPAGDAGPTPALAMHERGADSSQPVVRAGRDAPAELAAATEPIAAPGGSNATAARRGEPGQGSRRELSMAVPGAALPANGTRGAAGRLEPTPLERPVPGGRAPAAGAIALHDAAAAARVPAGAAAAATPATEAAIGLAPAALPALAARAAAPAAGAPERTAAVASDQRVAMPVPPSALSASARAPAAGAAVGAPLPQPAPRRHGPVASLRETGAAKPQVAVPLAAPGTQAAAPVGRATVPAIVRADAPTSRPERAAAPGVLAAPVVTPPGSLLARAGGRPMAPGLEPAAATAVSAYSNRFGPARVQALEKFGGTPDTERAVRDGLRYLAHIQRPDGAWGDVGQWDSKYGRVYVGKSALCLLAFLGAGHTPASGTEHSAVAGRAVAHLLSIQDGDSGAFGPSSAYGHGIATYALTECYGITKDPKLRAPVERALTWILEHQGPRRDRRNRGGWGYFSPSLEPEDDYARMSITAWMVMALESARLSGIELPDEALPRAREFTEQAFDQENGWFRYNHMRSRVQSGWPTLPASTPAGGFCLQLLGATPDDARVAAAVSFTVERRPEEYRRYSDDDFVLRAQGNVYFWYYGTLCCFLAGGESWQRWNERLRTLLPAAQDPDGSFAPIDVYAQYAGDSQRDRSYTTAMCVLSLEIYYRYFTPLLLGR